MRLQYVIQQLGILLLMLSVSMLPFAAWSACEYLQGSSGDEDAMIALLASALIGAALGMVLFVGGRSAAKKLGRKEALLLVALAWVIGAALAAAPYRIWAAIHDFSDGTTDFAFSLYVNCYFEAMSGLTTTGASILTDVESIPHGLLLWRAFTHWIGGLGIVVLFVAVLPILGVGGKRLFRFEAPGPKKEGVRPRIRAAAQVLWLIYLAITIAEILLLKLAGLSWFNCISHAFATLATGGFSTQNASITGLGSWKVELIIIAFMFLAGVNFGLYDQLLNRRWREVLKNPELRAYFFIMLSACVIIGCLIIGKEFTTTDHQEATGFWARIRHVVFTTVSIQTTTGFCTADFNQWAFPAKAILVILMFVGGCGGSTGGGVKVIRFVILAKVLRAELGAIFRPHVVQTVVGRSVIDPQMRSATCVYFVFIGFIVIAATAAVVWIETPQKLDTEHSDAADTAFTAVVATLNNIGPGLDLVGPTRNYSLFEPATKMLLCVLMALGRLELYAFLVLIMPTFWQTE